MRSWLVLWSAWTLCVNGQTAFAAEKAPSGKQIEMRWSELGAFLVHGHIKLVLPTGTFVEGEALAVTPEMLAVNVAKSSDRQAYPNGRAEIPRSSITTIQLTEMKNARGRVGLTLAGLICGIAVAAVAGMAAEGGDGGAAGAGALGAVVGLPVGGYFAGRAIDRKDTLIKILPD